MTAAASRPPVSDSAVASVAPRRAAGPGLRGLDVGCRPASHGPTLDRPVTLPAWPPDRGLRADRRPAHRRPGRQERLDRLALPAALRLPRLLRRAARRRGQRPLAALPGRRLRGQPALRRRLGRARDDVHHRHRRGHPARRDADRRRPGRRRPPAHRHAGHGADPPRVGRALRLRHRAAVGPPPARGPRRAGDHRGRRPRQARAARARGCPRRSTTGTSTSSTCTRAT